MVLVGLDNSHGLRPQLPCTSRACERAAAVCWVAEAWWVAAPIDDGVTGSGPGAWVPAIAEHYKRLSPYLTARRMDVPGPPGAGMP